MMNPWVARPLTVASRDAKFREAMSVKAERAIMSRSAVVAAWAVFAAGVGSLVVSSAGWMIVLPLKTVEPRFYKINEVTGTIEETTSSVKDAPRLFGSAVDAHTLYLYLKACEAYDPNEDKENDHVCKVMSSPDQQARQNARRKDPTGPLMALGRDGHVDLENLRYHLGATDLATGTHRYTIQYERTVWRGPKADPKQPWTATVEFQWHPEMSMTDADRGLVQSRVTREAGWAAKTDDATMIFSGGCERGAECWRGGEAVSK
jgi:type IV secretory pathway component VirB8